MAFAIDPDDGSLAPVDQVSSNGTAPCYVSVDADGRHLYVANYLSGSIAAYTLRTDGRFGELVAAHQHRGSGPTPRQEGPHAHCILPGPGSDFLYAVDLGADRLIRYARGRRPDEPHLRCEDEFALEPGSGPRHLVFHPQLPVAFLVCELDSTIVTLGLEPVTGRLSRLGTRSTLPESFAGKSTSAEVRLHPNGRHVYVSNRGHDSIAVFRFTSPGEAIEPLGHVHCGGESPRNFAVHPSTRTLLVANQDSDNITPFRIDPHSGVPEQLDLSYALSQPVCLTFLEVAR